MLLEVLEQFIHVDTVNYNQRNKYIPACCVAELFRPRGF